MANDPMSMDNVLKMFNEEFEAAKAPVYLHLRDQSGQPYGSQSRKCDHCGLMLWPERYGIDNTPLFTEDRAEWEGSKDRCSLKKERMK